MQQPFDSKNRMASFLDRLALHGLLLLLCTGYFYWLWRSAAASVISGGALYVLLALSLSLLERRTLKRRDRLLRERIGGAIALSELLLLPAARACERVCALLCACLDAEQTGRDTMRYEEENWLIRCAQCPQGSRSGEGDVLAAHRARIESGADKCALLSTGSFTPAAIRMAEWMEPPVRLIAGRQLALLFGRQHPASDEEIARHALLRRQPFSFRRIRALALSAAKLPRYLLCALLLCVFYLLTGSAASLISSLLAFFLAILCGRENRRSFRL